MNWRIHSQSTDLEVLLNEESLFFTGNGYIGVRGNFEEGYPAQAATIRGTYLNAFYDIADIPYGEKHHGFPEQKQKIVNLIDAQTIRIALIEHGKEEWFSLFAGDLLHYDRFLHLDKGYTERLVHWRSPSGKEIRLRFRRLVSLTEKELFIQEVRLEPVNFHGTVKIVSTVTGDVSNYVDDQDPRIASDVSKLLSVTDVRMEKGIALVEAATSRSGLRAVCATTHDLSVDHKRTGQQTTHGVVSTFTFSLSEPVVLTRKNIYMDSLRHGTDLIRQALQAHARLQSVTFPDMAEQQTQVLRDFWQQADITIESDRELREAALLQEGIRFNLYHLLQSIGRDPYSNIAAKGLSGEGYEGHYFWDTEIFMFPVFLFSQPDLARQLLIYRYATLEEARIRARELGHQKGALFPWRTISGSECSSFFPAGTAQYHISADIAYSYVQYYLATRDLDFFYDYGAEMLFETARLWVDLGHYHQGQFHIHEVTGPDEYTCLVNNNYYTNVMAKYNLKWAAKMYAMLKQENADRLHRVVEKISLDPEEVEAWLKAAAQMYLPYDAERNINPQDDDFLNKKVWDFAGTPADRYPLLLHYHPLTLYRHQVCKQADTVLAHFLLEDEQDFSVMKDSYDYYEKITTHDSSLSSCVFSIMASRLGYQEKAYDYFRETARLDLDNIHGNTKDGLHLANMGGTWMAIVMGFAGLRLKEKGLSFAPSIPEKWNAYSFSIQYLGRLLHVSINQQEIRIKLVRGEGLSLTLYDRPYQLDATKPVQLNIRKKSRFPGVEAADDIL
ncbi:MAG: glycoside hydrolase family 65 protein [Bacillaceae bacterium]|nr:glycoside hydrolase family 65 protein [Bacillaceae bacterium]